MFFITKNYTYFSAPKNHSLKNIMKNLKSLIIALVALFSVVACKDKQKSTTVKDPIDAKIYTLKNGLTVYMSVNKDAPRIQTFITVKAGSKNDPADATGLAHYLEHMLFKGTDKFGSKDFSKEGPLVAKIDSLFEVYRSTTDSVQRVHLYAIIDSVSLEASKYAIPNEYDKMLATIGATGTNAFTSYDRTAYVNDIPSNQLENWLTIEAERFRNPVLRLFHTELEAVYEEKNRGLDDDNTKAWYALLGGLFEKHTYGTQTVIGTIEHLKNPSLKKITEYYNTYYVPNNMAICLSGDFDPEKTLKLIEAKFGGFASKEVPVYNSPAEDSIKAPIIKDVWGPYPEEVALGFRFAGYKSDETLLMTMVDMIMSNSAAGLIDLNINQKQLALSASSTILPLKDYSIHLLFGTPKEGQTLDEVRGLMLSQLELVKKGEFADWLIPAIIANMKKTEIEKYETNRGRASAFMDAFIYDIEWNEYVAFNDKLSSITKQSVMDFAKSHYGNNYVVVNKHKGPDTTLVKVVKPKITPIQLNKDDRSPFTQSIIDSKPTPIEPVFVDYKTDIKHLSTNSGIEVLYKVNSENDLFDLYFIYDLGSKQNKKLAIATNYLSYLGTKKYTAAEIQQEFYKLACSYDISTSDDETRVHLSGLTVNFDKALKLLEDFLTEVQPDKAILDNLIGDIIKERANAKQDKNIILQKAMKSYGVYGAISPFTNILSEAELKALQPDELTNLVHELGSYQQHILFYGPLAEDSLKLKLESLHKVPAQLKKAGESVAFTQLPITENKVYVVEFPMQQAEILMLAKGDVYDKALEPYINVYNDYFGTGMSSIVFQEIRESRALAYSTYANYSIPSKAEDAHYNVVYVGTQADKLPEAMAGITGLLNNMPKIDAAFEKTKTAVEQKMRTARLMKANILLEYEKAKKLGLDYDRRKDNFEKASQITFDDINKFYESHVKGKPYTVLVMGDKKKLDMKTLQKYGKVEFVTLEQIFGY